MDGVNLQHLPQNENHQGVVAVDGGELLDVLVQELLVETQGLQIVDVGWVDLDPCEKNHQAETEHIGLEPVDPHEAETVPKSDAVEELRTHVLSLLGYESVDHVLGEIAPSLHPVAQNEIKVVVEEDDFGTNLSVVEVLVLQHPADGDHVQDQVGELFA